MNIGRILGLGLFALLFTSSPTWSFKLSPGGSFVEKKLASRPLSFWGNLLSVLARKGIYKFGEPVHEEITNRILGCEGDSDVCGAPDYDPDFAFVLAGIRWNDDPPFRFEEGQGRFKGCTPGATVRLGTFPLCWANVFKDGERRGRLGEVLDATTTLLVRSHFGDLQFLHAMATADGEEASFTRRRILAWAELTWRTARREYPLSKRVKDVPVREVAKLFGTKGWSIQDLFALGNERVRRPDRLADLAFGSLLHVVQDSFAEGHVDRAKSDREGTCRGTARPLPAPGKILEFRSYAHQNSDEHAEADSQDAFAAHRSGTSPNVVEVGRALHAYYERNAPWSEVKPYVECIFALADEVRPASAGERFAR